MNILAAESANPLLPPVGEIIIGLIAFAIVLVVMFKFVAPQFEKAFRARRDAIEGGIERAEAMQAEAKAALEQYRAQLAEARTEAAQIRDAARAEGQQISAIAALAFFAYSYHLGLVGYDDVASAPALITAVLAGACLGFLPHNFSPARIFMGDSGSMLVGLMLSAAAVSATGQADPQTFDSAASLLPLALPLLVPVAVLFIPFADLVMAVVRRTRRGQSPFSPDKMHLHHRLLSIGHSHRRAVLIMYFWAALLSFGAIALSITGGTAEVLVVIGSLLAVGVVVVLSPRARRAAIAARQAELAAMKQRSRSAHPSRRAGPTSSASTTSAPPAAVVSSTPAGVRR